MNDTSKMQKKWNKTIESVLAEISYLANIDDVYMQVFAIMENNPELRKRAEFQDLLHNTYITTLMVGIRRLSDQTRGTDSLWRLLSDMKQHLRELKEISAKDPYGKAITHRLINAKITQLEKETKQINKIVNDFLAHRKTYAEIVRFNYDDIRKALAEIFLVFKWCRMMISGTTPSTAVPVVQYDWLYVFRFPWLSEDEEAPTYKKLDDFY